MGDEKDSGGRIFEMENQVGQQGFVKGRGGNNEWPQKMSPKRLNLVR